MAKKNIISDFSTLKGKVTFSEKTSSAKVSPKVTHATATPKPKESNDGLKIGQSVVLMDSNLRGKIVGLGKTVRIESRTFCLYLCVQALQQNEEAHIHRSVADIAKHFGRKENAIVVRMKKLGISGINIYI